VEETTTTESTTEPTTEPASDLNIFELYDVIKDTLTKLVDTIVKTTEVIDSINFDGMVIVPYLGYARYVMGDVLYVTLTSLLIIGVGVTLWTYVLKGIGYLKNLLPW
jgi:uncharacterized protein YfbU (UPF0304 family)